MLQKTILYILYIHVHTKCRVYAANMASMNAASFSTVRGSRVTRSSMIRLITGVGDVVLCRKDARAVSYVLASVVDDAAQNISHVIRGEDLFEITRLQVLLQNLLGLATPIYHHHRLIRDETGKRLAKRDDARAIRLYRAEGATPDDIRRMVGLGPASRE